MYILTPDCVPAGHTTLGHVTILAVYGLSLSLVHVSRIGIPLMG